MARVIKFSVTDDGGAPAPLPSRVRAPRQLATGAASPPDRARDAAARGPKDPEGSPR